MKQVGAEFVPDPEFNGRLNSAIEAFQKGPLISETMSKVKNEGDPSLFVTNVYNFADDQHIAVYKDIETGIQSYFMFGNGTPELIAGKMFRKRDDQVPLAVVDPWGEAGDVEQTASGEEARHFLDVLNNANREYETHERTDLLGATNARLKKLLTHDLAQGNHPLLRYEHHVGADYDFSTVRIVDHELFAKLSIHPAKDGPNPTPMGYTLVLNGDKVPERLRRRSVRLNFDNGIHLIDSAERDFSEHNKEPNLLFYPNELQSEPENGEEDTSEINWFAAPLGVLSDAEAQYLIDLLGSYMDGTGWEPVAGTEATTPPTQELIEVTRALVKRIYGTSGSESSAWSIEPYGTTVGKAVMLDPPGKWLRPKMVVEIIHWAERGGFTVDVNGKGAPDELAGLQLNYDAGADKATKVEVRESSRPEASINPIKFTVDSLKSGYRRKRGNYPSSWLASYAQVQALNELLETE